jgi:glycosyltransferase involved in cell wall biosynthesis
MAAPLDPFISVVIPTFNGGEWLLEAIASCLQRQAVTPEVIVVDDASTDDTPDRVAAAFPQVRLVRLPSNSGSGSAGRNRGLELSRGRYVKFLDHDDLLEPGTLALELEAAEASEADMVMTRWGDVRVDAEGHFIEASRRVRVPPAPERLLDAMVRGEELPYTAAVLYRRAYIEHQRWDARLTINDDFDWFCRNALRGGRIIRLDHVSYYWRLHDQSIQGSQRHNRRAFVESVYIHDHVYRHVLEALRASGQLTTSRADHLADRLYLGLRCLARFNGRQCRRTTACILQLDPHFRPGPQIEPRALIRFAVSLLGLRAWLALFALLRRPIDWLRPLQGEIRFFNPDGIL